MCLLSVQFCLQSLTFLRDADGAAAHPHSQCIHSCINQILGLSCSHDCHRPGETEEGKKNKQTVIFTTSNRSMSSKYNQRHECSTLKPTGCEQM